MLRKRKATAFLMSLLVCTSNAVTPLASCADEESAQEVYEENSEEITEVNESENTESEEQVTEDTQQENFTVSGNFSYSLTEDGNICIEDCTSEETELVIPDSIDGKTVTELGKTALGGEANRPYTSVSIPSTVDYISAENPFIYCPRLAEITVDPQNKDYCSQDGILYNKDKTSILEYPQGKQGKNFSLPQTVTEIGIASIYMTSLEEINFPDSLKNIKRYGIGSNLRIKSIDLSSTAVEEIGMSAFIECTSLEDVKLPDSLYSIEGQAFALCKSLTEITLPEKLEAIGQNAFMGTGLESIVIPPSVVEIGYSAFGYDENGNPDDNFTIIGDYNSSAYIYSTDSDDEYDYHNNFQFIATQAYESEKEYNSFDKSMFEDFEYTAINGEAMITMCVSSESRVEIPSEINGMPVTRLYKSSFSGISAEEIIVPDSVKTIDTLAFYNDQYLSSVVINGAETIGEDAFGSCISLKNITISGNCKEIQGDEPFLSCPSLEEFSVSDGDGEYSSENGVLYNKDKSVLVAYPASKPDKVFTAPKGTKEIQMSAFCYAKYIESIVLPDVEKIGFYAFEGCKSLKSAEFSESLNTVSESAFADCDSLQSVRLCENLENIGDYAFGFVTNPNPTAEDGSDSMMLLNGFKIYTEKGTTAYKYANACGIKTVAGTVKVGENNVSRGFLYTVCGIFTALLAGGITATIIKKRKGSKK